MRSIVWLLALGACLSDPDYTVFLGRLDSATMAQNFNFPSRVARGEHFTFTVFTFGSCVESQGTDVVRQPDGIHIWVWDRYHDDVCFDSVAIPHAVSLSLEASGANTLHVHGRISEQVVEVPVTIVVE